MQQVGSHQQDIVAAKARRGCRARGHWRCHTTSRATESAGPRLAFALCSPGMCYGCVGGTHSVPPLLSDAELFWRRNAFALLNAAGWVCSRVAFRGWKSDTGPGCKVKGRGQREVFPPHPPSAAGVSYPDVSAGTNHPAVALSPGTGGQGHAGGYLDAHPEVKQLFGPPEISGVSIPSQTCGNTFKKL